jgi:hypothetical protein
MSDASLQDYSGKSPLVTAARAVKSMITSNPFDIGLALFWSDERMLHI